MHELWDHQMFKQLLNSLEWCLCWWQYMYTLLDMKYICICMYFTSPAWSCTSLWPVHKWTGPDFKILVQFGLRSFCGPRTGLLNTNPNNVSITILLLQTMSNYDCFMWSSSTMVYRTPPDSSSKATCLKGHKAYANASGLPHQHQCYAPTPSLTIST